VARTKKQEKSVEVTALIVLEVSVNYEGVPSLAEGVALANDLTYEDFVKVEGEVLDHRVVITGVSDRDEANKALYP
jgi:hypothetical protein